ncbi:MULTISPECIES: DNA-directed RNA polymerase subunit beta [Bacillaceae]|jgi:ABC-type Fe3+ transport system permease subunit|uniref:DNA-directed RNA polymerase subunit beta n=1 Tax=Bacillaceae TaxID=186817 RepID=UPI00054DDD6B|nr:MULTISPECIES: DNA-directed RNA polymerase subunit beta [Bacillaceae]OXS56452.1 hydroxymyristoyl-ACP dehydratase [Bacillus sp. DSM 27956]PFG04363.1 DNA-directed RNA polymerase subunit beta [Bacillus sp. es.034]PRX72866.1 DNA-directed RNA polymerase subunit beta [Bacillus sp. V-88]SLK24217.1 DNA-directed RNA polymerase subunit beta [Bacillus sp. V-88]
MSEKELLQEKVTRESVKTEKKAKQKDETKPSRWVRVRMLPIWLRILLFILLLAGSLVLGAVIGFAGIGNGNAADVFKAETWQHIIDIVVKK